MIIDTRNIPSGVSASVIRAIGELNDRDSLTLEKIAKAIGHTLDSTSGTMQECERLGLVSIYPGGSARVDIYVLSTTGEAFAAKLSPGGMGL